MLHDGDGLRLVFTTAGSKKWQVRYRIARKAESGERVSAESSITIGTYPDMSLAQARERSREIRAQVKAGADPVIARASSIEQERSASIAARELLERQAQERAEAARRGLTLEAAAWEWFERRKTAADPHEAFGELGRIRRRRSWRPRYAEGVEMILRVHVLPELGRYRVHELGAAPIADLFKRLFNAQRYDAARKACIYLTEIFHELEVPNDPMPLLRRQLNDALGVIAENRQEESGERHHVRLPLEEFPAFLQALGIGQTTEIAPAPVELLKFTLYTAVRISEARLAQFTEINGDQWEIPASRMKNRQEHVVPLSRQALAIVNAMRPPFHAAVGNPRTYGYVFTQERKDWQPLGRNPARVVIDRLGYGGRQSVHGLRAVFSDIANQRLVDEDGRKFRAEVIEYALSHYERSAVRRAYFQATHYDERAVLMQAWADHVDELAARARAGNVTPMRRRRK